MRFELFVGLLMATSVRFLVCSTRSPNVIVDLIDLHILLSFRLTC